MTATDAADAAAWPIVQAMLSDAGKQDPAPCFRALHALGELFRMPDGSWMAVGYDACAAMLRSPDFVKQGGDAQHAPAFTVATAEEEAELAAIASDASPVIVALDAPDHTRLRGLVQRSFMPRHVRSLEEAIPVEIDRLLAAIDPTRPVDIIARFSAIFAPEMMAQLIGLPSDRREEVARLTATLMRGVDPAVDFATRKASALAARAQRDYIRAIVADRRAHPRDDLITGLALAGDAELSEAELVSLIQVLYLGGYETTAHMVGNGIVALLEAPDQFAALAADGGLMRGAIEEMLRFDGAISLSQGFAARPIAIAGREIEAGATCIALLTAANRDPAAFPEPDRFDIARKGKPHLAFAGGPHFCLGANLARAELTAVFDALLTRFPRMRLVEPPRRLPAFHQRAYGEVLLLLDPAEAA